MSKDRIKGDIIETKPGQPPDQCIVRIREIRAIRG
jgi:hypothetical protein